MNNKKIFSFHMFLQTLKQTRLVGFIMTAIIALISAAPIISEINYMKQYESTSYSNINGVSDNYFLVFMFVVIVPILSFVIWSFLNKRSSSDFYHSVPYTRLCIYLSKTAAILSWTLFILIVSYGLKCGLYLANRKYFIVDYATMTHMYLAMFICCVLCMSVINVAVSVTGSIISNICVTGLIMFLPRFLCMMATSMAYYHGSGYMTVDSGVGLLDCTNNMLVGFVMSVLGAYNGYGKMVLDITNNIYSLALALIYIVLGAVLFIHRKSETAGKAANGKVLPMIIRTLVGFVAAFIGVMLVYTNEDNGVDGTLAVVISFIISAIIVFIYEWMVSRKASVFKKCIPAILLGYVLAVVLGTGIDIYGKHEAAYIPEPEDISYVVLSNEYIGDYDYYNNVTSQVHFDDAATIKYVSEVFQSNKKKIDQADAYSVNRLYPYNQYSVYRVGFREKGVTHYRYIRLNNAQVLELGNILKSNENYAKAYMDFPESSQISISMRGNMEDKEFYEIYSSLVEEACDMGFSKWYSLVNSENSPFTLDAEFVRKGNEYTMTLPISKSTPKTYKKYVSCRNAYSVSYKKDDLSRISQLLREYVKDSSNASKLMSKEGEDIGIVFISEGDKKYINPDEFLKKYGQDGIAVLNKIAEEVEKGTFNKDIDVTKPIIVVNYSRYPDVYYGEDMIEDSSYDYSETDIILQLDGYDDISDYIAD